MLASRLLVADLFSGAGGLSEGFRQAGCRILVGSDIDPDACATYALNFPEATSVHGDIREAKVRARVITAATMDVDIIVGGPPCQAFSQMRNHSRLIDDPRNSLYREFVRILNKLEPKAFVMENVLGLEQMGVREQVLEDLSLDGIYNVSSQVLDAADFGVPQTRKRIIFIGIHNSIGAEPPNLVGSGASESFAIQRQNGGARVRYRVVAQRELFAPIDQLHDAGDAVFVTAEQAISDLSDLRAGQPDDVLRATILRPAASEYQRRMREGLGESITNVSVPRINSDTKLRLSKLPPGGNVHDLPEALTKRHLSGELWGPTNGTGLLGRKHYYAYRRLHPQLWSWTLNTKADSVYHYGQARALSVREFARLQSFPDRFTFTTDPRSGELKGRISGGGGHSRYRQVGNAVPPLLARAIAERLVALLASSGVARKSA